MALTPEDKKDVKGAFGKALANKVSKVTRDKPMITLKSGEQWPVGKKMREKKEKPLKSWGDDLPRMSAGKVSFTPKNSKEKALFNKTFRSKTA